MKSNYIIIGGALAILILLKKKQIKDIITFSTNGNGTDGKSKIDSSPVESIVSNPENEIGLPTGLDLPVTSCANDVPREMEVQQGNATAPTLPFQPSTPKPIVIKKIILSDVIDEIIVPIETTFAQPILMPAPFLPYYYQDSEPLSAPNNRLKVLYEN